MRCTISLAVLASLIFACGPQQPAEEEVQPARATSVRSTASEGGGFPFTDVTAASGIDFVHYNGAAGRRHFPETMGPGLALFDVDGDGDLDLYAVDGAAWPGGTPTTTPPRNRLYLNRGTDGAIAFEDATDASGVGDTSYGMGVTVGDVDGDGDLDLYLLNYGTNVLYRNQGGGRFEPLEAGVEDPAWSVGGAFLDHDGDGDLDLYVVNYLDYVVGREAPCKAGPLTIYCSPEPFAPVPDRLYRNDGVGADGVSSDSNIRFTEVSRQAGITANGRGMGIAATDLDDDGDTDLYVTNDRSANFLYRNDGGRFEEIGALAGVGYGATGQIEGGMGAVAADFTGTGQPAIFFTNFHKEPNRFFVAAAGGPAEATGDGLVFFDDWPTRSGLGFPSHVRVRWGIGALDFEGDGDLDLAVANGHVYDNAAQFVAGSAFRMADQLFTNDGEGRFEARDFPGAPLSSRGVARGDLDGDGDADLVVASCAGRLRVWRNDAGRPQRFLIVELVGKPPNTHAYGAQITAEIGGLRLRREVAGGGSYASHGSTRVDLGLGDADAVDRLEVRWPAGLVEEAIQVAGGQKVVWRQGEGIISRQPLATSR